MTSKDLTLAIEPRTKTGTTNAHRLRREGKIPGVLYGHGTEPLHVAFEARAFDDLLHHGGRTNLITLTLDGKRADTALVRELQRHPVSHKVEHVDLQRVSENEAVHASLPIVTTGTARGVRDSGGVMDIVLHEVEVEGPANQLPSQFELDVTNLGIHDHITAGDIPLPKGFKMLTSADTIIVSIEASKTARQLEEAEVGTVQLEPEIIGEPAEPSA